VGAQKPSVAVRRGLFLPTFTRRLAPCSTDAASNTPRSPAHRRSPCTNRSDRPCSGPRIPWKRPRTSPFERQAKGGARAVALPHSARRGGSSAGRLVLCGNDSHTTPTRGRHGCHRGRSHQAGFSLAPPVLGWRQRDRVAVESDDHDRIHTGRRAASPANDDGSCACCR
jgi:hypothetical protein